MGIKGAIGRRLPLLRDIIRSRRCYREHFGQSPHFWRPATFNEKVQRRKILERHPLYPRLVDKIQVKEFVGARLGSEWITPTLWHGDRLPPSAERNWPLPFVLKASHGSEMNFFARRADELDWTAIEARTEKWLKEVHGDWGGEWVYSRIAPRLLVETWIGDPATFPIDYKFWVFGGEVKLIQVDTDRVHDHKRAMFDRDWRRLPFSLGHPIDRREIPAPHSLADMIAAAEYLADDIPFIRIDLYEVDRKPRFGEMTFYPDSGYGRFEPASYDALVGSWWHQDSAAAHVIALSSVGAWAISRLSKLRHWYPGRSAAAQARSRASLPHYDGALQTPGSVAEP